jgi:hypothetical protein
MRRRSSVSRWLLWLIVAFSATVLILSRFLPVYSPSMVGHHGSGAPPAQQASDQGRSQAAGGGGGGGAQANAPTNNAATNNAASTASDNANSGDIKVMPHGDALRPPDNDPHISGCPALFDIYAYNFSHQGVSWTISQQPPTGTAMVQNGTATLQPASTNGNEGARYQGYLVNGDSLPDGHYKVVAHEDGTNAEGKQKVFWIDTDCAGGALGANATPTPTPTPSQSPSQTTETSPSPSPTPSGGVSGGSIGAGRGNAPGNGVGNAFGSVLAATATAGSGATGAVLAATGLPLVGGAVGGILILIGAGIGAIRRRINGE